MANLAKLRQIKDKFEEETIVPGCYTFHRPSQCNLKFPKDNRPIHKMVTDPYEGKELVEVTQNGKCRRIVVPKKEKIVYPFICPRKEYERLKQQSKVLTSEDVIKAAQEAEQEAKRKIEESEARKDRLKRDQLVQPGETGEADSDREPDQTALILKRAEGLKNDDFQGARIANTVITASKCHALRDVQQAEKLLIIKRAREENQRLDGIVEQARLDALKKEAAENAEQKARRLENNRSIREQIAKREQAAMLEMQKAQAEGSQLMRSVQGEVEEEQEQRRQKREAAARKLKEHLDKGVEELEYAKALRKEEEHVLSARITNFVKQRKEREAALNAHNAAVKAAKEKEKAFISGNQKAVKEVREELERLRNIKIQEDVERDYRRKEKDAAIKKRENLKLLKEARVQQITEIRRQIALEISREEKLFNNVVKQNEEDFQKEYKKEAAHRQIIEKHRQTIMKQINDKEKERLELRQKLIDEGAALRMEMAQQDKYEKQIIHQKVQDMRDQKIPQVYVSEVEHRLAKLKYY